ncbi:MAG TPA: hypothetical protein PLL78_10175 [Fimbriimonadaceae bacterium]|nr:hypothetical protein [Fimbriimonadaceae bacterium]HRJ97043.1 hypothetical protein [Fimbriimonadaceae bacterium]
MSYARCLLLFALTFGFGAANAQLTIPSDGSDGAFNVSGNHTIDLSQAPTASWNTPAPIPGRGV